MLTTSRCPLDAYTYVLPNYGLMFSKQDPVVDGTKFGVVFLAEDPRTASIEKGFECFGLYVCVLDLPLRHRYDLAFGGFWCRRQGSTRRLLGRQVYVYLWTCQCLLSLVVDVSF